MLIKMIIWVTRCLLLLGQTIFLLSRLNTMYSKNPQNLIWIASPSKIDLVLCFWFVKNVELFNQAPTFIFLASYDLCKNSKTTVTEPL